MNIWDELSRAERVVLTNALEEAPLNQVIGDYLGHRDDGGSWRFSDDTEAIAPLIPRFVAIVRNMIDRDLVQLVTATGYADPPDAPPMTDTEVAAALADPATWLPPVGAGPVMLIPTDHAVRLVRG
ncbi:hypothetical protein [Micromonospora sp. NPDC047074]|uniref:hypothetical protein n=1 Tax=Micromonospora sp. NPDC047074 TaxID=3154339 RepID=UPI0033FB1F18